MSASTPTSPLLKIVTAVATLLLLAAHAEAAEEFRDIFDGETLDGWEGDRDYWRVEDGAIIGEIAEGDRLQQNHWLIWRGGEVADFELALQFRLSGNPRANSGIQFRSQAEGINDVSGYQADLDQGSTWLGRIYDEHGRRLLVERGTRVLIDEQGHRSEETFAKAELYATLFRENEWNDYRITASGDSVSIEINGTLFSELIDRESNERDLTGQLAFQLHSGLHTVVEFRNVRLRELPSNHLGISVEPDASAAIDVSGIVPTDDAGRPLNLGFEDGGLTDWTVNGEAFARQPVSRLTENADGTAADGEYSVIGYIETSDAEVGTLTSAPFRVAHPWASLLVGGGSSRRTQVEIVLDNEAQTVVHVFRGTNEEEMRRVFFSLAPHMGSEIFVRLLDESTRPGGHVNYDDFRFHSEKPPQLQAAADERIRENPILAHLAPNPVQTKGNGAYTLNSMSLSPGFVAERIAAEPDLHQPIAFTFDARGRIWAIEAHSYPAKRPHGKGLDKILIFEDRDGDGSFESRKVFIEGLNLASGLEIGYGGVWVGAAPELLFIPDRDGNDVPDSDPIVLLDGFGYQDTHETLNSFIWGPDGWLYGNQGVFNYAKIGKPGSDDAERASLSAGIWRFHPIRHEFEIFAHGGSNQWGLDFNEMGELFMTQCRSRWGGGPTTHIVQGGHYWNQANRGHAPFVSGKAAPGFPVFRNYLMASARYGHGEGGAGKPGSRAIYGGHSPVGTMVYLGDNWPEEYRDHLFTHNLHGHQINHQINLSEGSGYNTIHSGKDILYSPDPAYVAVELKYGPDGAVYFSDWVDTQHCHNPNSEQWDRGNGRLYRMSWADTYRPVKVDLESATNSQLVEYLLHRNDWFVRTARRLLHERAIEGSIGKETVERLTGIVLNHADAGRRLRALWALHGVGALDDGLALKTFRDDHEYVRAWTIQLLAETKSVSTKLLRRFADLASSDSSPVVRRYLASAMQRIPDKNGWTLAERLSRRTEDANDRYIPKMIWYGLGPLMDKDPDRAMELARRANLPALPRYADWYAAKLGGEPLDRVVARLEGNDSPKQLLEAIALGLEGQFGLDMPDSWERVSKNLYGHTDSRVAELALDLGSLFRDATIYPEMRKVLADESSALDERKTAFSVLSNALDRETIDLFASLIDDADFRLDVIRLMPRLDRPEIANHVIRNFNALGKTEANAALTSFTQNEFLASLLLDAVDGGLIDRSHLTAYFARALGDLGSPIVDEKLARTWGSINSSPEAIRNQIDEWEATYSEAPLWAFRLLSGKSHFETLCASCHQPGPIDTTIGPDLSGSGTNGSRYFLENIIDPNAVVGSDYAISLIKTVSGQTLSGIIERKTETAVTLRSLTDTSIIPLTEIASITDSPQSMMPPGLLSTLNERETIELLKYLTSL